MGNKSKKESAAALTELEEYLRRDGQGKKLLSIVKRYVGDLRQSKAKLKLGIERLETKADGASRNSDNMSQQLADAKQELLQEKADHQQTFNEMAKVKSYVEGLEGELTDPGEIADSAIPDGLDNANGFKGLLKQLRRLFRKAPEPDRMSGPAERVMLFDIRDFVTDYNDDGYKTIGMLTVATCLMFGRTGFFVERESLPTTDEKTVARFVYWARSWVTPSALEEEIFRRSDSFESADLDGRPVRGSKNKQSGAL